MKILQTIPGLSAQSGGPSTSTLNLLDGLLALDVQVDLLTIKTDDMLGCGKPWLKVVPDDYKTPFAFSRNICNFLNETEYDLYHANALWMGVSHITCKTARRKGKPYIVSPHGMLYPTALEHHALRKKLLLNLWYYKDVHHASCLHVTCEQEAVHCRRFGYKGPIAIIPNAIVLPKDVKCKTFISRNHGDKLEIGFLGRLHPIKKIERVFHALALLKEENPSNSQFFHFQIMGKGDENYEKKLRDDVKKLSLEGNVEFVGFVSGREKFDRLSQITALMVPSEQENFGMIVPEALICGTPVYASHGTPWNELNECQAGWWTDNEPETIAQLLKEILSLSDESLLKMGKNGRILVENKYEQHKVAGMMKELYQWIIVDRMDITCKPSFVYY